ncbi:MAG: ribosome rescue GTPase HflX [Thiohalomonadaceae bacterium]
MFERPKSGERVVLVHLELPDEGDRESLQELEELALSAGAEPVATITGSRRSPDPKLFIGTGKADEVRQAVETHQAELVLFNHALSPAQERNLERLLECRVLDRTGLILDIFAQRARSHEGKLQVELAQLRHLSTRLVRGWTHLERQQGGIGLRGPGETQLETDRRLLGERIRQLQKRLAKVERQREQGRRARKRAELPTVSLVGYTNAGKSTLFNNLTSAGIYVADQLFATLDPTLRRVELADGQSVVLADTVGFIRHLPHDLVAAFRSTLQETRDADLLLHVIDVQDPERLAKVEQVQAVLAEIGTGDVPVLEVYNKIDLLEDGQPRLDEDDGGQPLRVYLSAVSGIGTELLLQAMTSFFRATTVRSQLCLPPSAGRLRAALYAMEAVQHEQMEENGGWRLDVEIKERDLAILRKQHEFVPLLPLP